MNIWHTPDNRVSLSYGDAGTGPAVLLVHAFPLCREMWAQQVAALSDKYRVLTPDVLGFGGSPVPAGGWSLDAMADALAEFLTGIGVSGPVVFGGLSMGGYIALAFARRHPGRLRGLILADTRAEADTPEARANRDKTIAFARANTAEAVVEQMLPKLLAERTRSGRPEVAAEVRRMGSAQTVDGVAAALAAMRDRPDATPGLRDIRVPTLVLVGSEDVATPPDAARTLAGGIPGAKLEQLPGVGHLSNLEAPEAFTAAVRHFLDGLA